MTQAPSRRRHHTVKRLCDLTVASGGLLLLLPLIGALAAAVAVDSPGPAFYRQERLGRDRKPFLMVKLRTMHAKAEPDGARLTVENDPRITRVGRFLRRYHLDELPQLWNVVRGEMSLVGPRPERRVFADRISAQAPEYERLFGLRPGLTSLGMVCFGYASTTDEMIERMKFDLHYLDNTGFGQDMKILIQTLKTVVTGKGL